MADQADERLRALKASMKEALGKLIGSAELEAEGALERSGGGHAARKAAVKKKKAAPRKAKARAPRPRS